MRPFGQGRPTAHRCLGTRWIALIAAFGGIMLAAAPATGVELDVRIRFAWGSNGRSPQKWYGSIAAPGAKLSNLQPLGVEADEAAALRLIDDKVIVSPLAPRTFDGFDVQIRGDESTLVKVELRPSPDAPAKTIEAPLKKVATEQFRAMLDDLGGDVLIHRAPGDKLRVHIDRDHLVFSPGESLVLNLHADLAAEAADGPLTLQASLHGAGSNDALAELSKPYDPQSAETTSFEFTAPSGEGAYRIRIAAESREGFASRLAPWAKGAVVASREVEFVVIDPAARLPRLGNRWEAVSTIDPANSSWWQRVPQWTQFDKLPAFATPRPLGNVRPAPAANAPGLVQLPATAGIAANSPGDGPWQAYLLPVRRPGEPHAVEIELPRGARQHLGLSIVEPDATGRVMTFGRDCGVFSEQRLPTAADGATTEIYRLAFWPRTKSPALVVSNRSLERPAQYGKIRLLRRASAAAADEPPTADPQQRLVAAYIASPRFADSLGAGEHRDAVSGLSMEGWSQFLTAANRLAQQLRATGHNGAIITVAADGASLAPIEGLGASPRFDAGLLSSTAADPLRKDVLEALLRIFDREGLQLIPAVQLAAPLPGLEALAGAAPDADQSSGVRWVGRDGRTWNQTQSADSAIAPHYNLLSGEVQAEVTAIADRLLTRYGNHPSFRGLGVQLSSAGFATLPGLGWGLDDATMTRFAAAAEVPLPTEGPARFQQRAALLMGQYLPAWRQWRQAQLTAFYLSLSERVSRDRPEIGLVLCTEDLFVGQAASDRLRQAVAGRSQLNDALDEIGVDLDRLAAAPHITTLRPRRLTAEETIESHAVDHRLNTAVEMDRRFVSQPLTGELVFHPAAAVRLPSFDAQSPFGADRTYFDLASPSVPAGDDALQAIAAGLTSRDFVTLVSGAEIFPLADNEALTEALRAFQELPVAGAEVRTERRQPVTLRVYRDQGSTTLCLINESHWPVDVELPIACESDTLWRQLGADPLDGDQRDAAAATDAPLRGSLARGAHKLAISLPPYGIHARRYSSRTMQLGALDRRLPPEAELEMVRRVQDIEARMSSLNIERAYPELQNPHFELLDDAGEIRGWQPRIGQRGKVEAALNEDPSVAAQATVITPDSGRSVHLRSEDALGVAVQSHLFPIPATGQIVVRVKVRGALQPGAQLYAWIEYQSGGAMRQRYAALASESLSANWSECEFAVDDLPLGADADMRVQFHLTGSGDAWVDDVRLFDLRFADAQRVELSKRLLGAKSALEDGQLMDCQRLVDAYLPRRLVEHVPSPALAANISDAAVAPDALPSEEPAKKGLAPRIRGMVPKILR